MKLAVEERSAKNSSSLMLPNNIARAADDYRVSQEIGRLPTSSGTGIWTYFWSIDLPTLYLILAVPVLVTEEVIEVVLLQAPDEVGGGAEERKEQQQPHVAQQRCKGSRRLQGEPMSITKGTRRQHFHSGHKMGSTFEEKFSLIASYSN